MKVILQQDVKDHGKKGQLVDVSDGYARNYLIPKKLAIQATADNLNIMKQQEKARQKKMETEKTEAQAADELLDIVGVQASFVVARCGDHIFVSGRSIGIVNVQIILEKLGGGGSKSTAGAQVLETDVQKVVEELKLAVDKYMAEQ